MNTISVLPYWHCCVFQVLMINLQKVSDEMCESEFDYFNKYVDSKLVFSNFDMALVQSAFFASIITFPEQYGCGLVFLSY